MEQRVIFENSKGDKLCGLLGIANENKDKVAILCHGYASGKSTRVWEALTPMLHENHISTLRFDFYGCGESEGKLEKLDLSEGIDDELGAIKLVKERGFKRIVLVGSSFGGFCSIVIASQSNDLYALVLRSPACDYQEAYLGMYGEEGMREWKKKGYVKYYSNRGQKGKVLNYSFIEDSRKYNAYKLAKQIKVSTLIVHGTEDEVMPFSQSQKLATLIPNATLTPIEGADHIYLKQDKFNEMVKEIADYIVRI